VFERLRSLDSVITLTVEPPLRLVEALVLREEVQALIAARPAVIVLDVAGLVPDAEMGVLMLPTVARDAAAEGIAVVVVNPSRALLDRLWQLGVRDLTCADRPEGSTGRRRSGPLPARTGPKRRDEALPGSPCPFCSALATTEMAT
jgi:anti-anti-sigma regulatory factor